MDSRSSTLTSHPSWCGEVDAQGPRKVIPDALFTSTPLTRLTVDGTPERSGERPRRIIRSRCVGVALLDGQSRRDPDVCMVFWHREKKVNALG